MSRGVSYSEVPVTYYVASIYYICDISGHSYLKICDAICMNFSKIRLV